MTKAELIVSIIRASNLPIKDQISQSSDPYYVIKFQKKKKQTMVRSRNLNPSYNSTFRFKIKTKKFMGETIKIACWDRDVFQHDDYIGKIEIPISQLVFQEKMVIDQVFEFEDCSQGLTWIKLELINFDNREYIRLDALTNFNHCVEETVPIQQDTPCSRGYSSISNLNPSKVSVYIYGGQTSLFEYSSDLYEFKIRKNEWKLLKVNSERPKPRIHSTLIYYKNFIYLVGGLLHANYVKRPAISKDIFCFDLTNKVWKKLQVENEENMPSIMGHCMEMGNKNVVYIIGGYPLTTFHFYRFELMKKGNVKVKPGLRSRHMYSRLKDFVFPKNRLKPPPRYLHSVSYSKRKDRFYLFGGVTKHGLVNDLWMYHFANRSWSKLNTIGVSIEPRHSHQSEVINTRLIVYGGFRNSCKSEDSNHLYLLSLQTLIWKRVELHHDPCRRMGHVLFSQPGKNSLYIYGGFNVVSDEIFNSMLKVSLKNVVQTEEVKEESSSVAKDMEPVFPIDSHVPKAYSPPLSSYMPPIQKADKHLTGFDRFLQQRLASLESEQTIPVLNDRDLKPSSRSSKQVKYVNRV